MADIGTQGADSAASRQTGMTAPRAAPVSVLARSLGVKFFVLGALVFILSMPLLAVWGLVQDREANFRHATAEIGRQWGGNQTFAGPLLEVPVTITRPPRGDEDKPTVVNRRFVLAPDSLTLDGTVGTETRKRGIHEAVVYQSALTGRAVFSPPDLTALGETDPITVDWSRARVIAGLSDLKGIESLTLTVDGREVRAIDPGLDEIYNTGFAGFGAPAGLRAPFSGEAQTLTVDLDLKLKGSQEIRFAPAGDDTTVSLTSAWPHPSFSGTFLPQARDVSDSGFKADWSVPKLARAIPHVAFAGGHTFSRYADNAFGVRFYQPIDFYKQVERAVKYGVLFVSMAFLVIFVIEVLSKGRMHLVHYAMTGMMIVVFYTMLLALAEFIGFTAAYALAAGATGTVIAGFVSSLFAGRTWTVVAFGGFVGLYGFLYVVLQLAEAALLVGSVTGFVILSILMFATRDIDWSGPKGPVEAG